MVNSFHYHEIIDRLIDAHIKQITPHFSGSVLGLIGLIKKHFEILTNRSQEPQSETNPVLNS